MMQQQDSASRAAYSITVQELARRIGADAPDCRAARERAEQTGLTLVGFCRPGRATVYTHPQRLIAG